MRRSNIETDHVSQEVFSHAAGQVQFFQFSSFRLRGEKVGDFLNCFVLLSFFHVIPDSHCDYIINGPC